MSVPGWSVFGRPRLYPSATWSERDRRRRPALRATAPPATGTTLDSVMPGRSRNPTVLAAGSLTSGLLAYGFFAVSTRALGAELAAPVSVLWTYWSFAAACLTFPLQHWIARTVAAQEGEGSVRAAMSRVIGMIAAASLGVGFLSWLGRDQLFHRDDIWFPVLVALVTVGSGFIGIVRGGLAARHQFTALALTMVADNGLRCASAIVLSIAGVDDSAGLRDVPRRSRRGRAVLAAVVPLRPRRRRGVHRVGAALHRRSRGRPADRPGRADRWPGRAGAGRRRACRGDGPLRGARAVPRAVHDGDRAGVGADRSAHHARGHRTDIEAPAVPPRHCSPARR